MLQKPCFYADTVRERPRNRDSTPIPFGNAPEIVFLRRYRSGTLQKPCFCVETVREQSRNRVSALKPFGNGLESGYMLGRMRYAPTKLRVSALIPFGSGLESGYMLRRMRYAPTKLCVSTPEPVRECLGGARKKDRSGLQQKSPDGEGLRLSRSGVKAR